MFFRLLFVLLWARNARALSIIFLASHMHACFPFFWRPVPLGPLHWNYPPTVSTQAPAMNGGAALRLLGRSRLRLRHHLVAPSVTATGPAAIARARFSSKEADPEEEEQPPQDAATIVQGPSLLTSTSVYRPAPTLFHLPGLRSLPVWTAPPAPPSSPKAPHRHRVAYNDPKVAVAVERLEASYEDIRAEYMDAIMGSGISTDPDADAFRRPLEPDYDVSIRGGEHAADALHTGTWDWHSHVLSGQRKEAFAERCPKTAAAVDGLGDDLLDGPFSFCFFSTLQGKSRIKPHNGPMNLRLRIHLPLIVPDETHTDGYHGGLSCGIRVGSQIRRWEEGRALVLDDSYEHEVWNDTDSVRVLLLVDVWHPDVTLEEKERIRNMFGYAQGKGWIGKEGKEDNSSG